MTITAAREQFLADVITTAVEGGVGYWSQCSQYQWTDPSMESGRLRVVVGEGRPDEGTRATIEDMEDDNREHHITPSVIQNGIGKIKSGKVGVNKQIRTWIAEGDAENDAGMIDADCADVIVQAGLFGEVRYG
jgi:hypothetical protein